MKANARRGLIRVLAGVSFLFPWLNVFAQSQPILAIRSSGGEIALHWQFAPGDDFSQIDRIDFTIERTEDFSAWKTIQTTSVFPPFAPEQIHSAVVDARSGIGFYRVLASVEGEIRNFTAASGEEVFGYAQVFDEELAKLGEISTQEFADLFEVNETPAALDFDPTTADYWDQFQTSPEDHNANLEEGEDPRLWDFRLNPEELAIFKQNGFVVSERLGTHSFAEAFYRIYTDDFPVYISSDAILQAWHRTFSSILMESEATLFYRTLEKTINAMRDGIPEVWEQYGDGPLAQSILDADYFLAVAEALLYSDYSLSSDPTIPEQLTGSQLGQSESVQRTLDFISALKPVSYKALSPDEPEFNLFGRGDRYPDSLATNEFFDFSQFTVRGHYDQSPQLTRYFKTIMWLNRVDFRIAGGEPYASTRELGTAIVLNYLLNQHADKALWDQFQAFIKELIGLPDNLTFAQLGELLQAAGLGELDRFQSVEDLLQVQEDIDNGNLGVQQIQGHVFVAPLGPEKAKIPRSASMMGAAFVIDGWAMKKVVYEDVIWQGIDLLRWRTSALDVAFSVLGNDHTVPWIVDRINDSNGMAYRDGLPYQHNLAAVRNTIESQDPGFWQETVYSSWLNSLRLLKFPYDDSRLPQTLRTHAWQMKNLNTQLASWTQLKHDTLLYGKQPYSGLTVCFYPYGYVEPVPEFYSQLKTMTGRLVSLLQQIEFQGVVFVADQDGYPLGGFGDVDWADIHSSQLSTLGHFQETMQTLADIAATHLDGVELSEAQLQFIRGMMESQDIEYFGTKTYSGWYPQLFYLNIFEQNQIEDENLDFQGSDKWDPLIVDIHTDPNEGAVLHEAVGNVHMMLIAIDAPSGLRVYAGPVLSHYEFYEDGFNRLSDSNWKNIILNRPENMPPHPEWTEEFLVPGDLQLPEGVR